ncbi:LPXTG-site transpeptidase (sortase) family protein [Amycolatopsis sulphurea]|uniref:LPXTG-site transpeptidase (Sortase) family protein n=1 Tax=Amycolatopsis sulphurea TaxID=76022 RepID=A0A2A9F647_9PSEU|nr:class F sortase [Amycolatopsis sulphurea]PFG46648.1 LPXTG-site transpeptidase (sortase) family protein [Amycolatopsis sulphurea]
MTQPATTGARPRRRARFGLFALLLALVANFALLGCGSSDPAPEAAPAAAASLVKSEPVSIDVPSIDAHSSLVPLGLNEDKTVQVPPVDQPLQAGWYRFGPTPGEAGPAVVLGHIDGNHQKGIFWRLHEMKKGDQVVVGRKDGSKATFTVTKVDQIAKKTFPTEAVYGNTSDAQIRLITCGGTFDPEKHSYLDNIIVYGTLAA